MAFQSLRSRVIVGSLLWMTGLFTIASAIAITISHRRPELIGAVHNTFVVVFSIVCIVAGIVQLRRSLWPLRTLRARLTAVREGRERRVDGAYASEIQPLVTDLNALLDQREHVVARALAKAGDLAHGLKTPLAVLSREAELVEAAGHPDLAAAIRNQVALMNRQMDYHLAHARAAAAGPVLGARCAVAESAEALARTMQRLHAGRGLTIDVAVPAGLAVRCQREDLDEMLGNLVDNACKWAKSRVVIFAEASGSQVTIAVDDDGPGLEPSMRENVLQRGVRADEAAPGSGLGLAIVRDLSSLYGGSIALGSSPVGGLRAVLTLAAG
jgi:signal transduction histidine kinase